MASTVASRKAKARRLQQHVRDSILETFPSLECDDVRSVVMGGQGEDVQMSPRARELLNISIEAKNQERLNIWEALAQAETNAPEGVAPAAVFKRNHSDTYIALKLSDFLALMKK